MKQRLGALLCLALGAVLITTGVMGGTDAAAGAAAPTCQPPPSFVGLVAPPCPTGTITVNETTVNPTGGVVPIGGWKVGISSSNCTDPLGAQVEITLTIPDGGSDATVPLFIFTDPSHETSCLYALAEEPVTDATAEFNPVSPVTIPFTLGAETNNRDVALTNTFPAPTTSSSTPTPTVVTDSNVISASASPVTANTGPHEQVRASIYVGIALCLLGLVLLFGGRVQTRRARHRP